MISLVASDMDGTLLSDHIAIHPDNISMIKILEERHIPFIICTGRNLQMAELALAPYHIACPKILLNGAIVYDADNRVIERSEIAKEDARLLLEEADKQNLCVELMTEELVFITDRQARLQVFKADLQKEKPFLSKADLEAESLAIDANLTAIEVTAFEDILSDPDQHILKITIMAPAGPKVFEPLTSYARETLPNLVVSSSGRSNIEVNHKNAQKGLALARYASQIGVRLDQAVAFGDNFNDISMLEAVGHSFAMGNAEPEVQKIARYVTSPNTEAGVAKGLQSIL